MPSICNENFKILQIENLKIAVDTTVLFLSGFYNDGRYFNSVPLHVGSLQRWKNLKAQLCVRACTENILKTEHFENEDVAITAGFPCPSFPNKQIQNEP